MDRRGPRIVAHSHPERHDHHRRPGREIDGAAGSALAPHEETRGGRAGVVFPGVSFVAIWPELIVAITAVVVLMVGLYVDEENRRSLGYLSLAGLVVAFIVDLAQWDHPVTSGMSATFS